MARTVLRSRSGDIVTAVRLADRTGIVAASAPPPVEVPEPHDLPSQVVVELTEPGFPGGAMRRVRRNVLFTCAAGVLLVVGWIGGGTFARYDADPAPAVAAGAVVEQEQPDTKEVAPAPPTTSEAPKPASPPATSSTQNSKKPVTSDSTRAARKQAVESPAPASTAAEPRTDLTDTVTSTAQDPIGPTADQFQQLIDSWAWANGQGYRAYAAYPMSPYGYGYGYGR